MSVSPASATSPLILPLGDCALLVRFGIALSDEANRRAIALARRLDARLPEGATEIDPNLVSVLVRFDPDKTSGDRLAGELRLLLGQDDDGAPDEAPASHTVPVKFGGVHGPDLDEVAASLSMTPAAFIATHNARPLRVLTTGFAPGFVYCGFHPENLALPRRQNVRRRVPAGTVLFAAGQTAIAATPIPTGWHVIGYTDFANFDPSAAPPTRLREGDRVQFVEASA